MEEIKAFKIGDRVEQFCETCGEQRGHVVASISRKGKITRVSCPKCGSRVAHKQGGVPRASLKVATPYDRARAYRRGQTIMHPSFGEGEVTAIIEPGKMDVLFADRLRRLIHSNIQAA